MRKSNLILAFLCLTYFAKGQLTAKLLGDVVTAGDTILEFANVTLYTAVDSAYVNYTITDENGRFEFRDLPEGSYFLAVSYIGLPDYSSALIALSAGDKVQLPTIQLGPPGNELEAVEVTARRAMFEIRPDKIVFNVAGTINAAGSNALELLRKSPGVVVTGNDDITLLGQQGVKIFLDGKPSPLSGKDLADFLRTLQASEIEAIDIITNPSSKYDAQGSAGIIDIRLKKDKNLGLNTTLNLSYSMGNKPWYVGSVNANYRNKKVNLYGNYSLNIGESQNSSKLVWERQDLIFDQSNNTLGEWTSNNFKAGMDVYLSKRAIIGFQLNGYITRFNWLDEARTPVYRPGQAHFDSVLISRYDIGGFRQNLTYNLNCRFENSKGASLTVDVDYLNYKNPDEAEQPNLILDSTEDIVRRENIYGNKTATNIDLLTFRADLERKLLKGKLEAGFKSTFSKTDNNYKFYELTNGNKTLILNRTNQFIYNEGVAAAYFQYAQKYEKAGFQLGLRSEHTFSRGKLTSFVKTENDDTRRTYSDFFPSAGFSYQLNPKNSFQINYSRRIDRPSYEDLNPFVEQKDEFNFEQGNPLLTPEYTDKYQLTHSFNYQLYTSISYSRTKDRIVSIRESIDESRTLRRWLNLAEQKKYSLSTSMSLQLAKWWSSYNTLTGYYVENKADYGDNKIVDINARAFYIYSQHTFSLPGSFSLQLSGWYNSPAIWGATYESDAIWNIDLGIRKKFWEKRAQLSINVSDLFFSSGWYGVSRFGGLTVTSSGNSDSRRLSVYFSFLFGNEQVKENKRKTGLEEESGRIKTERSNKG